MRLGRERPRKAIIYWFLTERLGIASMRLGRERPRKPATCASWAGKTPRFNEAGARTPQKARAAAPIAHWIGGLQ